MSPLPIETPPGQNWSCHNCGGCCRQHLIEITEEERARIEAQKWTADLVQWPIYVRHGSGFRLNHANDGSCIFLDKQGLCRIHARFGEAAKPLACRIFPYAFHPAGKKIALSLRFSCPSVVANRGEPLSRKLQEIQKLAEFVVPAGAESIPAPQLDDHSRPDWPDFFRFQNSLLEILQQTAVPVWVRILQVLNWLELIENAGTASLRGSALDEVLRVLSRSVRSEMPKGGFVVPEPSGPSRAPFRLLLLQYARKDTGSHLKQKWRYRWALMRAGFRFSSGVGMIPALQEGFIPVPFDALEKPFGGIPKEGEEILSRYLAVKVRGIHYCGPAYYHIPFIEGFRHLALHFAATLWLARWLAAAARSQSLTGSDIAKALAVTDHHQGYTPAFGSANFRRRVRMLTKSGDIPRLVGWYAR